MRLGLPILVLALAGATVALADHSGTPVAFTAAGGATDGFSGDGRSAALARLNGPAGVGVGPGGIVVADTINQRVRTIDSRQVIRTVAGTGRSGDAGDGGPARSAELQDPTAVEWAPAGIVVADTANNRVRLIRPDGTIATIAGGPEQGFAGDGGPATAAQLNAPAGLEVAGGTVFVADTGNNRIRAVGPDGRIATIAGTGAAGFGGDGGPATEARLNRPSGLALTADGALLVADAANNRVRRIGPDGRITTLAGNGGASSAGDGGPAAAAAVNNPLDVAVNGAGEIFIAETGGNRVRRVGTDGTISRFAGAGGPRYRGDGGPAAKALLNSPRAIEIGPSGQDLLVADSDNNRIRYVAIPSADGGLLALAPKSASVTTRLRRVKNRLEVPPAQLRYVVSRAERVQIAIRTDRGRFVRLLRGSAQHGANVVILPKVLRKGKRRLTKGFYTVTLTATGGGSRVTKSMELIVR